MGLFRSQEKKSDATVDAARGPTSESAEQRLQEQEDLARLLAGAPDNNAKIMDLQRFARANTRHTYADGAWGIAAYTFSGLQHVHGQSSALTLLSMWAAGTTFLVNAAMRQVLTEASQAVIREERGERSSPSAANVADGASSGANGSRDGSTAASAGDLTNKQGKKSEKELQRMERTQGQLLNIATAAEFDSQRRNVFQLEAVGSWIWMLASLQQFRVHKRLKWCGYSSWMGLGCAAYYTFRHMYNILVL